MSRYARILAAVDGSHLSLHALQEAFRLGKGHFFTVMAVIPTQAEESRHLAVGDLPAPRREPYERALTAARQLARQAGVEIDTVCAAGEPQEQIVKQAEAQNCDLVVMGLKGQNLPEHALMGSTTARVIGHSRRDILVVPEHAVVSFEKVLLATDGSRYSRRAAARAFKVCRAYGGELTVVSALDAPPRFMQELPEVAADLTAVLQEQVAAFQAEADQMGIRCGGLVRPGAAYQVILELARELPAHLIIMGSHGRTGLKRLLMGSVTERVIGLAPCPVLVVKA